MSISQGVDIMVYAIQALCVLALAYGAYLCIFVAPHCGDMPGGHPRPGSMPRSNDGGLDAHAGASPMLDRFAEAGQ